MDKKSVDKKMMAGIGGGGAVGAWVGSSVGIAALGTAISGVIPLALIGGYAGYRITKNLRAKKARASSEVKQSIVPRDE